MSTITTTHKNRTPWRHVIEVRYLGPTNYKGTRVKLVSQRFGDSVTLSYDYAIGDVLEQALAWLTDNGFEVIGAGETPKSYVVMVADHRPLRSEVQS